MSPNDRRLLERARAKLSRTLGGLRGVLRRYEPVFVTGVMGSGTTLVGLSMARHFRVAGIATESALQIHRRSALHMERTERYPTLESYTARLYEPLQVDLATERRRVRALHARVGTNPGTMVIDKAPNTHMARAQWLAQLFPGAPLVVVFRDPRANIEGLRRKWAFCARATLEENVEFYRRLHDDVIAFEGSGGLRVRYVEYEAFVEDHTRELERLRTWLAVPAASNAIPLTHRPNVPGRSIRNVGERDIGLVKGTTAEALERLSATDAQQIERTLGSLYDALRARARAA